MLEKEDFLKQQKARENMYKILSVLYYIPQEELFETELLDNLKNSANYFSKEVEELAQQCKDSFNSAELDKLKIDHSQLFVGPFELKAHPYGSVYLDDGRQIMGDSTLEVIKKYQAAGLNTDDKFKEPPDHISIELEFMYYLIFNSVEELKKDNLETVKKYYEQQEDFLANSLLSWAKEFSQAIIKNAQTEAYSDLAKLTAEFLSYDYRAIDKYTIDR